MRLQPASHLVICPLQILPFGRAKHWLILPSTWCLGWEPAMRSSFSRGQRRYIQTWRGKPETKVNSRLSLQPQNAKQSERWHLRYCLSPRTGPPNWGPRELGDIFRPTFTGVRTRLGTEILKTRILSSGHPLHSQAFNSFNSFSLSGAQPSCSCSFVVLLTYSQLLWSKMSDA